MNQPGVELNQTGKTTFLNLFGDWNLEASFPKFENLGLPSSGALPDSISFETSRLGTWDTALLIYLMNVVNYCKAGKIKLDLTTLPDNARKLIELAIAIPEKEDVRQTKGKLSPFAQLGHLILEQIYGMLAMLSFTGECFRGLIRILSGKSKLRWRDVFYLVQECGPRALPIVTLISFLVGLIITFLGAVVLRRMAAEIYVSYIVGYGILREMGALMVGIIMAGRTGAAFAAEIGTMKVSEEIDALKTLGISPIDFIVMPRMLALVVMMPLLALFADFIGIMGGYFIASTALNIPGHQFFIGMTDVVGLPDFIMGIIKSVVFGVIIAFSGCLRGTQCGNSSGAVGIAATSAVVTSITFITIANAFIDWIATLHGF